MKFNKIQEWAREHRANARGLLLAVVYISTLSYMNARSKRRINEYRDSVKESLNEETRRVDKDNQFKTEQADLERAKKFREFAQHKQQVEGSLEKERENFELQKQKFELQKEKERKNFEQHKVQEFEKWKAAEALKREQEREREEARQREEEARQHEEEAREREEAEKTRRKANERGQQKSMISTPEEREDCRKLYREHCNRGETGRQCFLRLAKQMHSDRLKGLTEDRKAELQAIFKEISACNTMNLLKS